MLRQERKPPLLAYDKVHQAVPVPTISANQELHQDDHIHIRPALFAWETQHCVPMEFLARSSPGTKKPPV